MKDLNLDKPFNGEPMPIAPQLRELTPPEVGQLVSGFLVQLSALARPETILAVTGSLFRPECAAWHTAMQNNYNMAVQRGLLVPLEKQIVAPAPVPLAINVLRK